MNEYDYTGNKTKNYFTAYLQKCIRWKRNGYLRKKEKIDNMEQPFKEYFEKKYDITMEEIMEIHCREKLLLKEYNNQYPKWNELSDQRLIASLMYLCEEERLFIYQHVFEERTFEEMEVLDGMPKEKIKSVYYYSIRKIRKWMGGGQ